MSTQPLVSIVIPSYNTCNELGKMLNCILKQTYSNWELFVVDDGSADNSYDVVESFKDKRIHNLKRNKLPKGGQTCKNIGLEQCAGKYVVLFDSDDLIAPYCLQQRVEFMESHPDLDFGVFKVALFWKEDELSKGHFMLKYGIPHKHRDVLKSFLINDYQFIVTSNMYKRSSLMVNNLIFDEKVKVFQDFDFNLSSVLCGMKYDFDIECKPDYFYRTGYSVNSVCYNCITDEKFESTLYLFDKTLSRFSNLKYEELRKKQFLCYVLQYVWRLVESSDIQHLETFINFCREKYGKSVSSSIKRIANMCVRKVDHKDKVIMFNWRAFLLTKELMFFKRASGEVLNKYPLCRTLVNKIRLSI